MITIWVAKFLLHLTNEEKKKVKTSLSFCLQAHVYVSKWIENLWYSAYVSRCIQPFIFIVDATPTKKNPSSQIKCRRTFIDYVVMDVLEHIVSFHWCFQHKNSHHLISSGNLAKHIPSLSKPTATHPYTPCNFAPAQWSYIFVLNDFQIESQCSFIANDCMQHMQFSPRTVGKPCLYRIYNCNSFPIWVHVFLLMFIWETITKTHTRKRSHSLRWCSFMQFVVFVVAYAWTVHDEQSIQQNSLSIFWIA